MPQHKSCKKRMRTSKKQNEYNKSVKSRLATFTKRFQTAEAGDAEKALRDAISELDRAAHKGVIPKPRADRKKSRLAKELLRKSAA